MIRNVILFVFVWHIIRILCRFQREKLNRKNFLGSCSKIRRISCRQRYIYSRCYHLINNNGQEVGEKFICKNYQLRQCKHQEAPRDAAKKFLEISLIFFPIELGKYTFFESALFSSGFCAIMMPKSNQRHA